jgi:hypothetical protein
VLYIDLLKRDDPFGWLASHFLKEGYNDAISFAVLNDLTKLTKLAQHVCQ